MVPKSNEASARYDLIAQIAVLKGSKKSELADIYMHSAWAVRLESSDSIRGLYSPPPDEWEWFNSYRKSLKLPDARARLKRIEEALVLLSMISTFPNKYRLTAAILSISELRSRGENGSILSTMPSIKSIFPRKKWGELDKQIRSSIELEQKYQRLALASFEAALIDTREQIDAEKRAIYTYMTGEIARRLGDKERARTQYEAALKIKDAPAWLPDLVQNTRWLLDPVLVDSTSTPANHKAGDHP